MDLARLQYLLAQGGSVGEIGSWLDTIERRGGLYARRRAEAISLAKLRAAGTSQAVDPALVAAAGEDWIRRGDAGRAGELFSAAAIAELDGDRAIRQATQAAAAFIKADRQRDAAEVLATVAMAHPGAAGASAAHLQSAVSYAASGLTDAAVRVEAILSANLKQWPAGEHAAAARGWLVKLLSSQNRYTEAAEVATRLPASLITSTNLDDAIERWRIAIATGTSETQKSIIHRMTTAFRPLLNHELAQSRYRSAAAYLLDRELLADLPERGEAVSSATDIFCDQLLSFRRGRPGSDKLGPPPLPIAEIATWRLMRDGREYPQLRQSIATTMNAWPTNDQPSMEHAERLIWLGRVSDAVTMLHKLIEDSSHSGETINDAAAMLGASDDPAAQAAAIKMWDRLASGIPQGSPSWHQAKLRSIQLLAQTGNQDEARRRAKYILLTAAPSQTDLKQQYQSAAAMPIGQ